MPNNPKGSSSIDCHQQRLQPFIADDDQQSAFPLFPTLHPPQFLSQQLTLTPFDENAMLWVTAVAKPPILAAFYPQAQSQEMIPEIAN